MHVTPKPNRFGYVTPLKSIGCANCGVPYNSPQKNRPLLPTHPPLLLFAHL